MVKQSDSIKIDLRERLQFGFSKNLPLHLQTESAECGLACLSMIASYYGYRTDLASLRQNFAMSLKGTNLEQLVDIASAIKLVSRPLRVELEELKQLKTPCILHWEMNHFVVLKDVRKKGIVIYDPAIGIKKLSLEQVSKKFSGVALELTVAPGFKKQTVRQHVRLREMMGNVVGLRRSLVQITSLAVALEVFSLIAPFFNEWVVDQAVVTADRHLLLTLSVGFGLLMFIHVLTEAARGWAVLMMSNSLNLQWLANLFAHLLRLPISYFEKRHMGDVISRFDSIHAIQGTLTTSFIGAILDGIMGVGTLVMMLVYSPFLTTISITAIMLYIVLRISFYAVFRMATESEIMFGAKQHSMFMETIRGIQSIRLFGREGDRAARWLNVVVDQKNAGLRTQRLMLFFHTGNSLVFGIEAILVLSLGALLVIDGKFSVGMLFAFLSYKGQFSSRISALVDKFFELQMLQIQGARLADIALAAPEMTMDEQLATYDMDLVDPRIEIRNLVFRYGTGETPVLDRINLIIHAGESVAIVGPSGCGKTTLVKILLGIHTKYSGDILVGGIPMRLLGKANFRKIVGAVMQEDQLFAGSVAENISFFAADANQEWIHKCAEMAAVHDEILAMPMGYNSLVGDMGAALSGGQKQRILLARALYTRPKILFLDEATSHLDVENERLVSRAIQNLNLTRIIIAHRPETIASANRVISLMDIVSHPLTITTPKRQPDFYRPASFCSEES